MTLFEAALKPAEEPTGEFSIEPESIEEARREYHAMGATQFFAETGRHDPGFRTILGICVEQSRKVDDGEAAVVAYDLCILYRAMEIQRTK